VTTAMTDMIGNLLKFYSNAAAALTSSLQIFQERFFFEHKVGALPDHIRRRRMRVRTIVVIT